FAVREAHARSLADTRAVEAQRQTRVAGAARDLFQDMIVAVAPKRFGREAKVVDVLRETMRQLDAAPPAEGEVEITVRHAVGYALQQLGELDGSEAQLRRVLELLPGESNDSEHLDVSRELAFTLLEQGHQREAESLLRKVYEGRLASLGPYSQ